MRKEPRGELRRRGPASVDLPDAGVRVLESHHAPDFEMPFAAWPFHKICWVAVGRGKLEHAEGEAGIERDDFLLLPAEWPHRFVDQPGEPLTLVLLCLSDGYLWGNGNRRTGELWERVVCRHPPGAPVRARTAFHRGTLVRQFRLALREQGDQYTGWETALADVADRLLIGFARGHGEGRDGHVESGMRTVEGALEYIDAHPYETLQIGGMAERCGLSPRRFTDLFKQRTGETFSRYVNRQRIRYACERLRETGHILYACHESGFNDLAYFYRVFKKQTGLTPGGYLERRGGGRK